MENRELRFGFFCKYSNPQKSLSHKHQYTPYPGSPDSSHYLGKIQDRQLKLLLRTWAHSSQEQELSGFDLKQSIFVIQCIYFSNKPKNLLQHYSFFDSGSSQGSRYIWQSCAFGFRQCFLLFVMSLNLSESLGYLSIRTPMFWGYLTVFPVISFRS
jgi:hypothetical protein